MPTVQQRCLLYKWLLYYLPIYPCIYTLASSVDYTCFFQKEAPLGPLGPGFLMKYDIFCVVCVGSPWGRNFWWNMIHFVLCMFTCTCTCTCTCTRPCTCTCTSTCTCTCTCTCACNGTCTCSATCTCTWTCTGMFDEIWYTLRKSTEEFNTFRFLVVPKGPGGSGWGDFGFFVFCPLFLGIASAVRWCVRSVPFWKNGAT